MSKSRSIFGSFAWPSRSLAVISCALALLAAQPARQAESVAVRPVVVGHAGDVATASTVRPATAALAFSQAKNVRADHSAFSAVRQLHILATVELLHRYLLSELRLPEQSLLPLTWFLPVCIDGLPPAADAVEHPAFQSALPPPTERAFAIQHFLLAPPLS